MKRSERDGKGGKKREILLYRVKRHKIRLCVVKIALCTTCTYRQPRKEHRLPEKEKTKANVIQRNIKTNREAGEEG